MKHKTITHILKPLFLLLLVLLIGGPGWTADIVGYTMAGSGAATSGIAANYPGQGRVIAISGITSSSYTGTNGQTCYGWNSMGNDSWNSSVFSTSGYIQIAIVGQMKATNTGPRDFKAQYSLNGSSWNDVPDDQGYSDDNPLLVMATSLANFKFRLPTECDNKTSVYIRWVQNGTISVDGGAIGTGSTANASLKGVSVQGELFSAPTSQASVISIISITPTTITVGCTPGTGNRRILKINTINSFTAPYDNYNPTANATYGGSGEQVVYNGAGTKIVITVPSSTDQYWLRYYEYNTMDALTRYSTGDASSNGNPKLCALENIHTPTYSAIRLTRATLGATINTPSTGTITERGIFWGYSTGIDETSEIIPEGNASSGTFNLTAEGFDRGTTIFFKGYVTNESGTIMTSESSFSNIPVFTGTGNWETAARWNVQEVPGSDGDPTYGSVLDSPIINGICTLTVSNSCTDITINPSRVLNINPARALTVEGTLTNNAGTSGLKLLSTAAGTGSLMHNTDNVNATIQRYISGTTSILDKKYHLVSVPLNSDTYLSNVWIDSYLFTYVEPDNSWYTWDSPTNNILQTKVGAMVFYPFGTSKTYNITGQLNNGPFSPIVSYSGPGTGYNLVPNPYPSAIDWNAGSGWNRNNISGTIYGFNPTNKTYGSWNGSTGTNDVTNVLPVGQAFFVEATGSSPSLTMDNSVRLNDTKDFLKSGNTVPNVLHLIASGNEAQDEIAIQFRQDATSISDDDFDAVKFYSDMSVPQLSSCTSADAKLLSINALPFTDDNIQVPLRLDTDFTGELTFTAKGIESFESGTSVKLEDRQLNNMIDLCINPVYLFNHTPGDATDRFVLHFGNALGVDNPAIAQSGKVIVSDHAVYIAYPVSSTSDFNVSVYDMQGRLINNTQLNNSGHTLISISTEGTYILKLCLPTGIETYKIIVL
jgi:hypothetical protein